MTKTLVKLPFVVVKAFWEGLTEEDASTPDPDGSSFKEELKEAAKKGYERGLKDTQIDAGTIEAPEPPPAPAPTPPKAVEETFSTSTLSCERFEVSVDACIDYVDKKGNETRRDITTEEVYEYEDGVLVIRAFCHRRKDYRTFVSKRIRYWVNSSNGKPININELPRYLRDQSRLDLNNIQFRIISASRNEQVVFTDIAGRFTKNVYQTRTGSKRYRLPLQLADKLTEFVFHTEEAERALGGLNQTRRKAVHELVREEIRSRTSDEARLFLSKSSLKRTPLKRRKDFIDFVFSAFEGKPEQASIVQILTDELLDPSFKIEREKLPLEGLKEYLAKCEKEKQQTVADIKAESEDAEKKLVEVAKTTSPKNKTRKRASLLTSELNVVRNLARNECQTQLLQNLANGVMVFERKPFEEEIRKMVCALLKDKEINKYADLLLPYLGNGIQFGYLDVGLKKKNRGWYLNEDGVVVIDLNNINHD